MAQPAATKINLAHQENEEEKNPQAQYSRYVHKVMAPLARKIVQGFSSSDIVPFKGFVKQQLEAEYHLDKIHKDLQPQKDKQQDNWIKEIAQVFANVYTQPTKQDTSDKDFILPIVKILSPANQKILGTLIKPEGDVKLVEAPNFKTFVAQWTQEELLAAKARIEFVKQKKQTELELVKENRHLDLVKIKEKLVKLLNGFQTWQQVNYSPELAAIDATEHVMVLFEQTFTPNGNIQKFVKDLDAKKFDKLFKKKQESFEEELAKMFSLSGRESLVRESLVGTTDVVVLTEQGKGVLLELGNLTPAQVEDIKIIYACRTKEQRVAAQTFLLHVKLDKYVEINAAKCNESIVAFLSNNTAESDEEQEVITLISDSELSSTKKNELINLIQAGRDASRNTAIHQFVQKFLQPADLAKLYRIRLAHYLTHVESITADQIQVSLEMRALSHEDRNTFKTIVETANKKQQVEIKGFIHKQLNETQQKALYRQLLVRRLSDEYRMQDAIKELREFDFSTTQLERDLSSHKKVVESFVAGLDETQCVVAYAAYQDRLEIEKAKETSSYSDFERDCIVNAATLMACVTNRTEIPQNSLWGTLPESERPKLQRNWGTMLLQRPIGAERLYDFSDLNKTEVVAQSTEIKVDTAILDQAGTSVVKHAADLLEAKVREQKCQDGSTADISVCWRTKNSVRIQNANLGGDVQTYVVRVDKAKKKIKVEPVVKKFNLLNYSDSTQLGYETKQILGKVDSARSQANALRVTSLGFSNLCEEGGQLFVMAPGGTNAKKLNTTRAFGHTAFKSEVPDAVVLSSEAEARNIVLPVSDQEEVILIQGKDLTPNHLIEGFKSVYGRAKAANLQNELEKYTKGTVLVTNIQDKPVCSVYANAQFGKETAQVVAEQASKCVEIATLNATEEKHEAEFKRLDPIMLGNLEGKKVSLGGEMRALWAHSKTIDQKVESKMHELKLLSQNVNDAKKNTNEIEKLEKQMESLDKAASVARAYVDKTLLVTNHYEVVEDTESKENKKPKTMVLKPNAIYSQRQLDGQLARLEKYRHDHLKDERTTLGKVLSFFNFVIQPFRALYIKAKSLTEEGKARAFAAGMVRTKRDEHAITIENMLGQLDRTLSPNKTMPVTQQKVEKEEKLSPRTLAEQTVKAESDHILGL